MNQTNQSDITNSSDMSTSSPTQITRPIKNLELTLSSRSLRSIPIDLISTHSHDIVKLDLTDNHLSDLTELPHMPRLHTLILDRNKFHTLNQTIVMKSLTTLWLNNNQFNDLTSLIDCLTKCCPSLTYLSMLRNPCVPDMYLNESEADAYQLYRYYVIHRLTSLTILDATAISSAERKLAMEKGPYCQVNRPKESNHVDPSSSSIKSKPSSSPVSSERALIGAAAAEPLKAATFIAKGKPRYDGTNSEGNRFIVNDDL
jgi:hypothetical protein